MTLTTMPTRTTKVTNPKPDAKLEDECCVCGSRSRGIYMGLELCSACLVDLTSDGKVEAGVTGFSARDLELSA